MPRKPRLTHPGYYHVLSRGVERRQVFLEKEDFHYFLTLLAHIKDQFSITVHAFCLMDNHYNGDASMARKERIQELFNISIDIICIYK